MGKPVGTSIPEWIDLLAEEAKKTHAHVSITFNLPDGGWFVINYHLPKKGGKK